MPGEQKHRRGFLSALATIGTGYATVGTAAASSSVCARRSDGETTAATHHSDGPVDDSIPQMTERTSHIQGPTALIVGGIHGDERAGIVAAHQIADWEPDYGRIVVIPEANPQAIEQNTRINDRGDLNRKFAYDGSPTSHLSRSIWAAVQKLSPDVLFTLQESKGIMGSTPSGVGQTVFHSPSKTAHDGASMGVRRANSQIGSERLKFGMDTISGPSVEPNGLLSEKATYEADIPSFIVETYENLDMGARVQFQETITRGVLDYYDIFE